MDRLRSHASRAQTRGGVRTRTKKRTRARSSRASSRSESLAGRLFSFSFSSRDASDSDSETAFETHLVARKKTFAETTAAVWEARVAGFWQGVVPSLVMVSNPALQYAFYEAAADAFKRPKARKGRAVELTAAEVFVAASLAKLGATVLTYPVLLVKSRLQAMGKSTDPAMRYSGTLDAARRIFREEGPAAFYRGFGTKVTQTGFAAALMFDGEGGDISRGAGGARQDATRETCRMRGLRKKGVRSARRPRLRPCPSLDVRVRARRLHPSSDHPVLGSNAIFSSHTGHSSLRSYHSYMHPR